MVKRKFIYWEDKYIMTPKLEHLVDLIFIKLKKHNGKEIYLEKENFEKFISSITEEVDPRV